MLLQHSKFRKQRLLSVYYRSNLLSRVCMSHKFFMLVVKKYQLYPSLRSIACITMKRITSCDYQSVVAHGSSERHANQQNHNKQKDCICQVQRFTTTQLLKTLTITMFEIDLCFRPQPPQSSATATCSHCSHKRQIGLDRKDLVHLPSQAQQIVLSCIQVPLVFRYLWDNFLMMRVNNLLRVLVLPHNGIKDHVS